MFRSPENRGNRRGFQLALVVLGAGGLGTIALPSFLASMNSVGELVEAILSKEHIADTNEFADAVEAWKGLCGGASLSNDQRWFVVLYQINSTIISFLSRL